MTIHAALELPIDYFTLALGPAVLLWLFVEGAFIVFDTNRAVGAYGWTGDAAKDVGVNLVNRYNPVEIARSLAKTFERDVQVAANFRPIVTAVARAFKQMERARTTSSGRSFLSLSEVRVDQRQAAARVQFEGPIGQNARGTSIYVAFPGREGRLDVVDVDKDTLVGRSQVPPEVGFFFAQLAGRLQLEFPVVGAKSSGA